MKHYSIISREGEIIAYNLAEECKGCFAECKTGGKLIDECPKYGDSRRHGLISNSRGITFLCCNQTKTTKLFRDKLEGLAYAYYDLFIPRERLLEEIKLNEQMRVNRLIHNLTSINAHNIQEIYDLVPQEILTANYQSQLEYIKAEISKDLRKAALMFLRIAKHNIHMKSEFSIYRKLERSDAQLDFKSHQIQKVLMNVLHTFFVDFTNNGIFIEVESFYGRVLIDYESIQVALYHLIENASKYTKPDTNILIQFNEENEVVKITITMTSLFVEEDERDKIFIEGFSGKIAKENGLDGDGIGMWRINQMMALNRGRIEFNCGTTRLVSDGITYGENQIILTLPKAPERNFEKKKRY